MNQNYPEIPSIGPFEGEIPPIDSYEVSDIPPIEVANVEENYQYETPKAECNTNDVDNLRNFLITFRLKKTLPH